MVLGPAARQKNTAIGIKFAIVEANWENSMKMFAVLVCLLLATLAGTTYAETATATTEETEGKSQAINAISYDADTKTLTVTFDRGTYSYADVPADVYEALKNSESQGTYYRENIKGKYTSTKAAD